MKRATAVCWLAGLVLGAAGCGAGDSQSRDETGPPALAQTLDAAPVQQSSPAGPQANPAGDAPIAPLEIAPPTAEQIAAWTPAPLETLQLLAAQQWSTPSYTAELAATADGRHYLTAGSRVLVWSPASSEPEHVLLDVPGDGDRHMLSLAVAPDGTWAAAGDSEGVLRLWRLADRQELATKELGTSGIPDLAISPDSQEIATIGYDSEVMVWSAQPLELRRSFKVDANGLKRVAYVAPGMLAAAGETTSLWNTATGERVRPLSPGRYAFALARSADGSQFLFGGDETLTLWDVAQQQEAGSIEHGVSGSELAAFSADGKLLATSDGRGVTVWNLADLRPVQVMDGYGSAIVAIAWLGESQMLAVASESGCTRLWGAVAAGAAAGLVPLHKPLPLPAAEAREPASPELMTQVMDLRLLPTLAGSEPGIAGPRDYHAVAPVDAATARSFYHHVLTSLGWSGAAAVAPDPAVNYRKAGFTLTASYYDAGDGKTTVSLHHAGNYDLRWAPRVASAPIQVTYEGPSVVIYNAKAALLEVETELLRAMHAGGWTAYSRLKSSHSETPDVRDLTFVRNGQTLRVSIGKAPADPASCAVQYSLSANDAWAPTPPDSGFVEFDGSTEPALVALTGLTLDDAGEFYQKQLEVHGWLVRNQGMSEDHNHAWLSATRDQREMAVGLSKLPDGRTLVQIGDARGSLWEASQQAAAPAAANETSAPAIEAADFPVLNPSKTAVYDRVAETIEVTIPESTLADAAKRYIDALAAMGWTAGEGGIRDEQYTMIDFTRGDQEFTLRARPKDGAAVVSFERDIAWTKDLPGPKQIVSYETWLRTSKLPPGLGWLDRYEAEMRAIQGAAAP